MKDAAGLPIILTEEDRERAMTLLLWTEAQGWPAMDTVKALSIIQEAVEQKFGVVIKRPTEEHVERLERELN